MARWTSTDIPSSTKEIGHHCSLESNGTVTADDKTGRTSKTGVWAGGDVVSGAATVISAMGAGKLASYPLPCSCLPIALDPCLRISSPSQATPVKRHTASVQESFSSIVGVSWTS